MFGQNSLTQNVICEPILIQKPSTTLTASTTNNILLDALVGKIAALSVVIRATSASNMNNALALSWKDMGINHPSMGIDVIDGASQSLYGGGQYVPVSQLKLENSLHNANNQFFRTRPSIMINFSDNTFKQVFNGSVKGFMNFEPGHKNSLSLVLPGAPVAEVLNLQTFGSSTGTYGNVSWQQSDVSAVDFSSTAALKSAFDALPYSKKNGIASTFSRAIDSTGASSLTLTTTTSDPAVCSFGDAGDLPTFFSCGATGNVYIGTSRSTPGVPGATTGTYDVSIIAWKLRLCNVVNGHPVVVDM